MIRIAEERRVGCTGWMEARRVVSGEETCREDERESGGDGGIVWVGTILSEGSSGGGVSAGVTVVLGSHGGCDCDIKEMKGRREEMEEGERCLGE